MQRILISALLLAAAAQQAGCSQAHSQSPAAAAPPAVVEVTPVVFKPLRQWSEFTGRLEAVDSVDIHPRVSGFVDGVRFQQGARVRKGEVLFQIDPRPYQAEVDRYAAELERARAKATLAAANADRGQRLMEQNAVAQSELERLQAEAKSAAADVGAAQAALRNAQLNLSFTRVVSPIDGRVSRAEITKGNLVSTGDRLTTVVSDGPIYASFDTDEQTYLKYASAERGKAAPVYLGLMDEDGFPHKGRLAFIDNAVNEKSGTINGRGLFDNADGRFTPGMFARIKLVSTDVETVALAPERALGTDLGKRFVLVLSADNHVEYRPVVLGQAVGELRIVREGLKPGDKVVVSGLQKVKPGDAVNPRPSAKPITTAELATLDPTS
jgi:multidrug efflux system membrane fusion protein